MAWAQRQSTSQQTNARQPTRRGDQDPAALFEDPGYGILPRSAVASAVAWNNSRQLEHLPTVLSAFGLSAREQFDEEVVQRIAEFQQNFYRRENTGGVDGKLGSGTRQLLESYYHSVDAGEVDATGLWPPDGASVEQQFEHWAALAALFGHTIRNDEPLLIGLRGVLELSGATHASQSINAYDDTFVLLVRSSDGVGVRTFAGATHAYQGSSDLSPNADGRGGGDVGSVRPTHDGESYTLQQRGDYHGRTSLGVQSDPTEWGLGTTPSWWALGHVPVHRDTNHDRTISGQEEAASESRTRGDQVANGMGDFGTVVWFHPGFTEQTDTGRPFASIGCLTARLEDVDKLDDVADVYGDIKMLVIEAPEAVARLGARRGG
ncbi:MAG: hypothetical protein H6742_16825 [Alphaproteobacteria bacterium]|nr:hypothetical protein [Alphaproteobacteria bacterium]